ncbi:hypothetical protein [Thermodesulfovibrio hydrogeniphilus]
MKKLILLAILLIPFSVFAEPRYNLPIENSPFIGAADAPLVIVEFIDYQ